MSKISLFILIFVSCSQNNKTIKSEQFYYNLLTDFNYYEFEYFKAKDTIVKNRYLDSLNIQWKIICGYKNDFISFLKKNISNSHNLIKIRFKNKNNLNYTNGYINSIQYDFWKDSFYSIFLIEAVLKEDYLFNLKNNPFKQLNTKLINHILINRNNIHDTIYYHSAIRKLELIEESKINYRILINRLEKIPISHLINQKSFIEINDSLMWLTPSYNSILKKDFSDSINRKSYKIKPSVKNFRIDNW